MRRRVYWIIAAVAGIALIAAAAPSLIFCFDYWYVNREAKAEMGPYVRAIRDEFRENAITGQWDERVSIDPKLIAESLERNAAEANLQNARFEKLDETFRQPKPPVEDNAEVYERKLRGLPCNTRLQLSLQFDENDRLVDASGAIFEAGCL